MKPGKFLFSLFVPLTLAGLLVVGCNSDINEDVGGGDPLSITPVSTTAPTITGLTAGESLVSTEVPSTDTPASLPTAALVPTEEPPTEAPPIETPPTDVPLIETPTTEAPTIETPPTEEPALPPTEEPPDLTASLIKETAAYTLSGIEPLTNGYHYEGWAIIDDGAVSTGKFNVNDSGELVDMGEAVIPGAEFTTGVDLSEATAFVLTIEPPGDTDATPSAVKYLAGDVQGDTFLLADLTVDHAAALGDDFSGASGTFILATPTDDENSNETSGIWFIDVSAGDPAPGLQLPELSEGFEYEGWVIIDDVPVSTGKFSEGAAADSGNPYGGANLGPSFPGEDFLQNAPEGLTFPVDILGKRVVISIEPAPDDSPAPFALKPLIGDIPADAMSQTNYPLDNQADGFPIGVVDIK